MNTKTLWKAGSLSSIKFVVAALLVMFLATPVLAADKELKAEQLVEKARFVMDDFMHDKGMDAFRDLLPRAKGVLIFPQLLKGAFIWGASGGSGVLLARNQRDGEWNGPAFYTLGGASFGLQIGGQASEVILLVMTDRGINSLLSTSLKLGVDAGVAAGPVGIGASAATANLSADILSFARSKGLYGGISLDGAVVSVRKSLNESYYGSGVTPSDILVRNEVMNRQARGLIETVSRSACFDRVTGRC